MPLEEVDNEDEPVMVERHHNKSKEPSTMKRHWQWLVGLFGACVITLGVFYKQDAGLATQDVQSKGGFSTLRRDCGATCRNYKEQHDEMFGGTLLDTSELLERVLAEKKSVIDDLTTRYGKEHFDEIFTVDGDTAKRDIFVSAGEQDISRPRLVRKMQMKLLSVQLAVEEEMANVDGCNCQNDEKSSTRPSGIPDYYQRFVWANGGHSASAGHGNFHDQSYTAVMEQTARGVFAKVGIELEGRNYAMGGMASAPELALCNQAVYGMDADIISWDFGMTDGNKYWKSYLYGNRVGVHPNRPAFMELGVMGRIGIVAPRIAPLVQLEEAGLTGMYMKYERMKNAIPDMQAMTPEEIDGVPEYLRHFRCGDKIEEGDPTCGANKFTETECKFKGRVSWHPGWKAHALKGNLMALFMIDLLIEALKSLDSANSQPDPKTVLDTLKRQEDADYERFFNANITIDEDFVNANLTKEVDATTFFRNPIICHTAMLPSETRYLGILTDTQRTSSFENYELGIDKSVASSNDPNTGTWPITYDGNERRECDRLELIDYKDWFYIRHGDGESSLAIPNTAERSVYLPDKTELQGLIVICFVSCPWGKCRPGYMAANEINTGNATMAVNGEPVVQAEPMSGCSLLRGEHGYYWKSNKDGQYKLTAELKEPNSFVEISSVILL